MDRGSADGGGADGGGADGGGAWESTLDVLRITHRYGSVTALSDVSLSVRPGEIHALLGQNGAGKSTLLKILTGVMRPTGGTIVVGGEPRVWRDPREATADGIGIVHQDEALFADLSVGENLLVGHPTLPARSGFVRRRELSKAAAAQLARVGSDVEVAQRLGSLDAGEKKVVAIARALATTPSFLLLDEPTAALAPHETARLLSLMRNLAADGVGIVFVTHRLGEVQQIADRATVLRDGRAAGSLERSEFTRDALVQLAVGTAVQDHDGPAHAPGRPVLRLEGVRLRESSKPFDFRARQGEVVGVIGLIGAGARELVEHLGGCRPLPGAAARFDGSAMNLRTPLKAQRSGVAFVPGDRAAGGIVPGLSVAINLSLPEPVLRRIGPLVRRKRLASAAEVARRRFAIKCSSVAQPIGELSGGNQQKVLVGRALQLSTPVLVVDEPTQGVDVASRAEIHGHLLAAAREGATVVFTSSDLDEVRALSHRIVVLHDGSVVDEFDCHRDGIPSVEEVTAAMARVP